MNKVASTQRFPLPTLPFNREISHPGVGTEVLLRGTPYVDRNCKSFSVSIEADHSTALLLDCRLGNPSEVAATATVDGKITSEVKQQCTFQPQSSFRLMICAKEHSFEVFLNDIFLLDFVHRVNPLDFQKLKVEGALYVEEIVITPGHMPSSMSDPLPPPPEYVNVPRAPPATDIDRLTSEMRGVNLQNAQHARQNQRRNQEQAAKNPAVPQQVSNLPQPHPLLPTTSSIPSAPPDSSWDEKRRLVDEAIKASLKLESRPAGLVQPTVNQTNLPYPSQVQQTQTAVQQTRAPYPYQGTQMPEPRPPMMATSTQQMPQPQMPQPQMPMQQPYPATGMPPTQGMPPFYSQTMPPIGPLGQPYNAYPLPQPPPPPANAFYATQMPQQYPPYYPYPTYGVYDTPTMVTYAPGPAYLHYSHCHDHC